MTKLSEHRLRGQLDAMHGKDCYYGCHLGMRSTLQQDKAEYMAGYNEVIEAYNYWAKDSIDADNESHSYRRMHGGDGW
jgi:hypothetical protein